MCKGGVNCSPHQNGLAIHLHEDFAVEGNRSLPALCGKTLDKLAEFLRADLDHSRELAAERARTVDTLTQALELMARALPPGPPAPMAYTEETAEPVEPDIGHPWRRWRNRT